ncbi:hypothetical protein D3C74_455280 [compost metagenome]
MIAVCLIPNQALTTQTATERMQEVDAEAALEANGIAAVDENAGAEIQEPTAPSKQGTEPAMKPNGN